MLAAVVSLAIAAGGTALPAPAPTATSAPAATVRAAPAPESLPLPGTAPTPGTAPLAAPLTIGQAAYDRETTWLWIPVTSAGRIDVVDTGTSTVRSIEGQLRAGAGHQAVGPVSATAGFGTVFVVNSADSTLCGFDANALAPRGCAVLPGTPGTAAYEVLTGEVWVTLPALGALAVVDVKDVARPQLAGLVKLPGRPVNGLADELHGHFFTSLDGQDRTLQVDVRTREVAASFPTGCGAAGQRGMAIDAPRRHLFVGCGDGVRAFDLTEAPAPSGTLTTGGGVDQIDWRPGPARVYVASGDQGTLTAARVDAAGRLALERVSPTAPGCQSVLVDATGVAWLPDSKGGRLVVLRPER